MNEALADLVKITVIATGFQRDTLPAIRRKDGREAPTPMPEPVHYDSAPPRFAEPEPVFAEELLPEVAAASEPAPEPAATSEHPVLEEDRRLSDLEVPAFLRRERKLFQ
jgi:cell division protein FtsZ